MRLVIDGSNVMGSRPDGWWRDRPAARRRLVAQLAALAPEDVRAVVRGAGAEDGPGPVDGRDASPVGTSDVPVLVVFDGRPHDVGPAATLDVRFAPDADDAIAALAAPDDVVATSDRELRRRCADRGATSVGAGALLRAIAAATDGGAR